LGLGPEVCFARNPKLVYGRMTGWGQAGPLAHAAGHDLNYVALTGLLRLTGVDPVAPPPTMMGDASGALGLAFGVVCAVLAAKRSGKGQVVDAAIVDVAAMMGSLIYALRAAGQIDSGRPTTLDAPYYALYPCADGKWISVGAVEPQFYALLLEKLGLSDIDP